MPRGRENSSPLRSACRNASTCGRRVGGWPAYEQALNAAKVRYQVYIYPGVEHGFNNDTTPRYDEAAAKLAWQRTIEFFDKHLRG